MSRTTILQIAMDIPTKTAALTGQVAVREEVALVVTGYETASAGNLVVGVVSNGVLLAVLNGLTQGTGQMTGVLNLNTIQAVAAMGTVPANTKKKWSLCVWDDVNECLLLNCFILVMQNPYNDSMANPIDAGFIGGGGIYAPLNMGVDGGNSHLHQTGDGGDLTPYLMARVPTGGNFRQSVDGLNLQLKDSVTGSWMTLTVTNGALGVS